jgi:putative toxin-antitoxin system antitoxin component (TIGR02293 family)
MNDARSDQRAQLTARAECVFGNAEKARIWLQRPTSALGGQAPIALLENEVGSKAVDDLLGRIEHGIAA